MSNRVFAFIQLNQKNITCVEKAVQKLLSFNTEDAVHMFILPDTSTSISDSKVQVHQIPDEVAHSEPKIRNYVNKYFKDYNFNGFLHVVSDNVELLDGLLKYANELENVMNVLDYSVHLATVTDPCNYVYSRYSPRVMVHIDSPEHKSKLNLPDQIVFTSHSNFGYVVYNFAKEPDDLLKLNESFTVSMFFIIEFLARRRNTKTEGSLYYMNQYLAIMSEKEALQLSKEVRDDELDQKTLAEEDIVFKKMNINFAPDNNIDQILETLHMKIQSKMQ